jgi:hypothetical protein
MLCRKLVAALARKRPSPLTRGKPEVWACAFEDEKPDTLAEAMAALEKGLAKWFKEQGIEVE